MIAAQLIVRVDSLIAAEERATTGSIQAAAMAAAAALTAEDLRDTAAYKSVPTYAVRTKFMAMGIYQVLI
eukprot:SAG31_NODE_86_length_26973_cov_16.850897_14_plen_70_part_00